MGLLKKRDVQKRQLKGVMRHKNFLSLVNEKRFNPGS
jgi:hypothetical protein